MSIFIFDLDGTIALIDHRRHHVAGEKKDWPAFFAACPDDQPNNAVIETLNSLFEAGHEIWIWSGRSDVVRTQTVQWLDKHNILYDDLKMRQEGDHRPDEEVKREWLFSLPPESRHDLAAIFDDRDSVVLMWRQFGIPCFQVAPGRF